MVMHLVCMNVPWLLPRLHLLSVLRPYQIAPHLGTRGPNMSLYISTHPTVAEAMQGSDWQHRFGVVQDGQL